MQSESEATSCPAYPDSQSHTLPLDLRDFLIWLRLFFSTLRLAFSVRWRFSTLFTCCAEGSFFIAADEAKSTHWCNCVTT